MLHLKHFTVFISLALLVSCNPRDSGSDSNTIEVWHSYAAGGIEEEAFETAISEFQRARGELKIEVVRLPFSQIVPQFVTATQGGEAPDIVRVADSHLAQIGHITIDGVRVLEDLNAHLTPVQRAMFDRTALNAMRMDNALLALPASQGTMVLLYNPNLFADHNIGLPRDDWTIDDLVQTAEAFRGTPVEGFSAPLRWSLWVMPFMTSYAGDLFDNEGAPRLNALGMAEAVDFALGLELDRKLVTSTNQIDSMKTKFTTRRAAMIIDGVWNVPDYVAAGIDVNAVLLPINARTGRRMAPLKSNVGWALSSESANKEAASELLLWLTSDTVQRKSLEETLALPTALAVIEEAAILNDPVIGRYIEQLNYSTTLPAERGTQQIFVVLDTALQLISTGEQSAAEAMQKANSELMRAMDR